MVLRAAAPTNLSLIKHQAVQQLYGASLYEMQVCWSRAKVSSLGVCCGYTDGGWRARKRVPELLQMLDRKPVTTEGLLQSADNLCGAQVDKVAC